MKSTDFAMLIRQLKEQEDDFTIGQIEKVISVASDIRKKKAKVK